VSSGYVDGQPTVTWAATTTNNCIDEFGGSTAIDFSNSAVGFVGRSVYFGRGSMSFGSTFHGQAAADGGEREPEATGGADRRVTPVEPVRGRHGDRLTAGVDGARERRRLRGPSQVLRRLDVLHRRRLRGPSQVLRRLDVLR